VSKTYSNSTTLLLAGTKRGLFLLSSQDRQKWEVDGQLLSGTRVYNATYDPRNGRMHAADNGDFFGTFMRYSDDMGETWQEPSKGIQFSEDSGLKLTNIWTIVAGRKDEPDTVYAGVDPATLWVSQDRGETWEPNQGLLNHPTRSDWNPGAGGLCLHSIVPDYSNSQRMWVGISAVGCMRTEDGGKTWTHHNRNTRADFFPENRYPEYGQCLHRLLQHPTKPDVLYQQNHCGIYKSLDAGENWIDIQQDLPSQFGFPIAMDYNNPDTVFVIVEGDARNNIDDQFTVYRTRDGGETWDRCTNGLPCGPGVRLGVLRHGMASDKGDPSVVYVGTNTGQIFSSSDAGDSWQLIADFLPSVYSVSPIALAA
jgi:photosystem II stability/assembly factor-like uncharacterized protein